LQSITIIVYCRELGSDNWNLLLSLDRTVCDLEGNMVVSSPIVVKNGFRIQFSECKCLFKKVPSDTCFNVQCTTFVLLTSVLEQKNRLSVWAFFTTI